MTIFSAIANAHSDTPTVVRPQKTSRAPIILHCAAIVLTATRAGAWKSPSPAFFCFRSRRSQDIAGCKAGPLLQNHFFLPQNGTVLLGRAGRSASNRAANYERTSPAFLHPAPRQISRWWELSPAQEFSVPPPLQTGQAFLPVCIIYRVHFLSLCFSCDGRKGQQSMKSGHNACVNARKYTLQ